MTGKNFQGRGSSSYRDPDLDMCEKQKEWGVESRAGEVREMRDRGGGEARSVRSRGTQALVMILSFVLMVSDLTEGFCVRERQNI